MEVVLSSTYKPWLCSYAYDDRPSLTHVYFEPVTDEKELPLGWTAREDCTPGVAVATDTAVLCIVPCLFQHEGEPPPTEGWMIDAKFLTTVSKQKVSKWEDIRLCRTADGKGVEAATKNGLLRSNFADEGITFPQWRRIGMSVFEAGLSKEPIPFINFSPKKLQALMDALGIVAPDAPTLSLCGTLYGAQCVLTADRDVFGFIAPVKTLGMVEYEAVRSRFITDDEVNKEVEDEQP